VGDSAPGQVAHRIKYETRTVDSILPSESHPGYFHGEQCAANDLVVERRKKAIERCQNTGAGLVPQGETRSGRESRSVRMCE
jgi:hypothetical protein